MKNASSSKSTSTYTSYVVRDSNRRNYLNDGSPRGSRWGKLSEASIFHNESDAARLAYGINANSSSDRAQVVPVTFFRRNS